jgi:XapX domain-containing protein
MDFPVKISVIAAKGALEMKGLLIPFVVGLLVGVAYGLIRVKSPAPPIVALIGLLGIVLGEQSGVGFLAKKVQAKDMSAAPIVSEYKHQQPSANMQSPISAVNQRNLP